MSDPNLLRAADESAQHRTSSCAKASSDAFLSTGLSPGSREGAFRTVHLIGPGQVGRAFLRQFARDDLRVVAVSDRTASVFDRVGVDRSAIIEWKERGGRLSEWGGAESIPTELAIRLVGADLVVDATPSAIGDTDAAITRSRAALQCGATLVLCSKNGLAKSAANWLQGASRSRIGINAVLGGAGAQLVAELDELRDSCEELQLVGNVTTTAIIDAVERGASIEEGIAAAQRLGFLEPDATLDLDGTDAAIKLLCAWSAVFGVTFTAAPGLASVQREDVRSLDPDVLRERVARGATTRLVARSGRSLGDLRVTFEEVAVGSALAAPADRVVYGYRLPSGLRVHTGLGVGYERTAEALWADVNALLPVAGGEEVQR